MRLLFFGDLARTGFGTVTMDLGRELLALGHDLRFVSQNDIGTGLGEPFLSRTWQVPDDAEFDPAFAGSVMGDQALGRTATALVSEGFAGFFNGRLWPDGWTPEGYVVLGDPGNVRLMVMRDDATRAAFSMVPGWHYVPIEGVDLPPPYIQMWSFIQPVAMCQFGAEQIAKVTGTQPPVVYHGVDSETFHPASPERMLVVDHPDGKRKIRSKDDAKRLFGAQGRRLIVRADRNVERKRYPEMLRALAPVLAARPDTSLLLHCNRMDMGGDLRDSITKYHPRIQGQIVVTNGGGALDRTMLAAMYNAADVYVSNSAEGFGLTIAEALACGTPAVGLDYSAVPEVIGPGGIVTPIGGLIDNEYGYFWAACNQQLFGDAVGDLLDDPARARALGRAGAEHVRSSFRWADAARTFSDIMAVPLEAVA